MCLVCVSVLGEWCVFGMCECAWRMVCVLVCVSVLGVWCVFGMCECAWRMVCVWYV